MVKAKQEFQAAQIAPLVDVKQIKLKIVYFAQPTLVNFMLVDKIHAFEQGGPILLHTNYISFGKHIVPLTNVNIMEVLDE